MLTYFCFVIFSICISVYIQKKDSKLGLILLILNVSLLAGFRDVTVGTDTKYYHSIFNNYFSGGGIYFREAVFMYISRALMKITGTDRIVFLFYAFLTNSLIFARLWKWRDKCSFSLMTFFYLTLYFPQSLNIMRQYVAAAFIFWAFDLVFENKYKRYVLIVLIASCFHTSALIAFVFLPVHYFMSNRNSIKKLIFLLLLVITAIFVTVPLRSIIYEYAGYFENPSLDISIFTLLRTFLFLSFVVLRKSGKTYAKDDKERFFNDYVSIMYGISIVTSFLGSFYDQMGRIGLSFSMMGIPFMTTVVNRNRYKQLYRFAYIVIAIMYIVFQVAIKGEQGIFPFIFTI